MNRTSTVVYIILLLGLVGAYLYLKNREQPADSEATAEPTSEVAYLFDAAQGTPSSIRLEGKSGKTVEVARDADGAWVLIQPIDAKADQGASEAAASQVTTMRIVDTVPNVDLKIVGLEVPEYVLTIKFTSSAERTVDIGVITPTESGYYVRDAAGKVVVISKSAIDALLGLLDNPPYQETPTPEADTAPSETATP